MDDHIKSSKSTREAESYPASYGQTTTSLWVAVTGAAFAGLTLIFFMGLVAASLFNLNVPVDSRFLVLIVLAMGAAMSVGFLGGAAIAQGKIPIPGAQKNVIAISATGGIAVLLIILLLGYYLYIPRAEEPANQTILRLPDNIPRAFTIENISSEAISDVGEVRTIGNKQLLYVEFRPGHHSGNIRLKFLKDEQLAFEEVMYTVTTDGKIIRQHQ